MLFSEAARNGPEFFFLAPWVIFVPLIGLLINLVLGGKMKERTIGVVASSAAGLSFGIALLLGISLFSNPEGVIIPLAEWIHIGELQLDWTIRVDTLSATMMLVVSGVGTLIHIYAIGYMHEDVRFKGDPGRYQRFFAFFNLFIAAMMILVTADNYLMLFVGWEGVGLCSFLLIGFWYDKDLLGRPGRENALAGSKAFIANRVGDFGFLMAGFIMFWTFKTVTFGGVFEQVHHVAETQPGAILAIALFMLLGVTGKSAQLPLFVWLPDAMAGPTPVSALIHAATMVTAGVYLVARSAPIFSAVPEAQAVVAMVGAITALFAATIAVAQYDLKKVLAYSTISQLGFMVAAVGLGAYAAGMFHLVTHAFFKALLFLSAGSVILGVERGHHHLAHHGDHHDQEIFDPGDMRLMGGLRKQMPVTFRVFLVGAIALAGIPPLAGFFSKDEILAEAFLLNKPVYFLLAAAAFLTAFYMGRQIWLVFFGSARHQAAEHAEESPPLITVPLIALAVLSTLGGIINLPWKHSFTHWLEHTYESFHLSLHPGEFNFQVALLSTGLGVLAIGISWLLYGRKPLEKNQPDPLQKGLGPIFTGMNRKWYVDEIYGALLIKRYVDLARFLSIKVDWEFWHDWFHDKVIGGIYQAGARFLAEPIDLGVIDGISKGLSKLFYDLSEQSRKLQTGYVRNYALGVFGGVVLILGYLILA